MFQYIKVDPITVEVLSNAFMSIAEEMGGILVRTAYSTNIKERKDCSCAIFNARGETIAQAEHIPVHLGSMLGIVKEITKKYAAEEIEPGDMFVANDPYMEAEYPIMVDRYEIRNDTGGAGEFRGGLGYRRDYRILQDTVFGSHGDRQKIAPWGLQGGKEGAPGRFVINPDTPNQRVLPSAKSSEVELRAGDIMSAQTPGSGGYGDPFKRRVDAVLNDVLDGKVSVQNAAELYGVVIDLEKKAVDETATAALRN